MTAGKQNEGSLTALDLQRAVLLVQRIPSKVHHASSGGGDPGTTQKKKAAAGSIPGNEAQFRQEFTEVLLKFDFSDAADHRRETNPAWIDETNPHLSRFTISSFHFTILIMKRLNVQTKERKLHFHQTSMGT